MMVNIDGTDFHGDHSSLGKICCTAEFPRIFAPSAEEGAKMRAKEQEI
jgi:hypothetical protein